MTIIRSATIIALLGVTSCGPIVSNTDKPTGVYVAGAEKVSGDFSVQLVDQPPSDGGSSVSGLSCKNKVWDPAPSNDVAIAVMRREAAKAGYDSVYVQSVGPAGNALLMNCWSAIEAKGIAFNG